MEFSRTNIERERVRNNQEVFSVEEINKTIASNQETNQEKVALSKKIQTGWTSLSKGKQMALGAGLVLAIAGMGYYGISSNGQTYVPLYSNLDYETAGQIKNSLEEKGVTNYKIGDNGSSILVLKDEVDRLRMDLAVSGVSPSNGTGYELFDNSSLGMTEQERNIMYQRALEGELRRSIMSLEAVSDARVHLNLVEESVFVRDEKSSTASVVLTLKGNQSLNEAQIKGIMALVSGAVNNLDQDHIDVIDSNGNLLSSGYAGNTYGASGDRINEEVEYEKHLEDKLKSQLGKVFGYDRMAISVRVSLNQTSEEQRKESYEEGPLLSQQTQFDRIESNAATEETDSPLDNNMQNVIDPTVDEALEDEGMLSFNQTNNYQPSVTETHTVKPPGEIDTISVSVIYSGELTDEMTKQLERQIASVVGLNEERGDVVTVAGIPFDLPELEVTEDSVEGPWYSTMKPFDWLLYGTLGVTVVSALAVVITKSRKSKEAAIFEGEEIHPDLMNGMTEEFKALMEETPKVNQADVYLKQLLEFFESEPEAATELLQIWISDEEAGGRVDGMLLTGMEKAARLLVVLGRETTSEIMKNLKQEDVIKLAHLIATIHSVPYEQTVLLMEEFVQLVDARRYIAQGGFEFAKEAMIGALGIEQTDELLSKVKGTPRSTRPFETLRNVDPDQIYNALAEERPQTIALVLCYLPSEKAAKIMSLLPEHIQKEVAQRIGTMNNTSSQTVDVVESIIENRLQSLMTADMTQIGGVHTVVEILNSVDRVTQKHIIELLQQDHPALAEEVQNQLFTFEDMAKLDNASLQRIIREINKETLALALKGVSETIMDCIMRNLSTRAAESLQEEISYLGPVRSADVDKAQLEIINVVRRLEDAGEIFIGRGGDDDVIM